MKWVFDLEKFKTEEEQEYVISIWKKMDGKEIYFPEGSAWGYPVSESEDNNMGYYAYVHRDWCKSVTEGG